MPNRDESSLQSGHPRIRMTQFRRSLLKWFEKYQRDLPWRKTSDPYAIWVSEIMLQQTQVSKVLEYYDPFLKQFPTIQSLAAADLQTVLKVWEKMGYYARARNLHKAARFIVAQLNGKMPSDYERLRDLPGVGGYVAAAVSSIAFNKPHAVVDGNVKRVLARLFLFADPVNKSGTNPAFQNQAQMLLSRTHPGQYNQAMMELGAMVCRPKNPLCITCPVKKYCLSYEKGLQNEFPKRLQRKRVPEYHIATGVIQKNNRLLITLRKAEGLLGGLWEFPGGKLKDGETAETACIREIREEVNLEIKIIHRFRTVRHAYTHFKIKMDVFLCTYGSGEIALNGPADYRWISIDQIDQFPFPVANHKFIPGLKAYLEKQKTAE